MDDAQSQNDAEKKSDTDKADAKADVEKAVETKSDDKKAVEAKSDDKKSDDKKAVDKKAVEAKSDDKESDDGKAEDKKLQRSLNDGLKTTRSQGFLAQIGKIFKGQMKSNVVDELEEILFTADIGVQTSELLLERVTEHLRDKGDGKEAMALLKDEVHKILSRCEKKLEIGSEKPHVILTIGVNGAGKTTTLGKLAAQLTAEGKKVLLIAGDTFRAAAVEQLDEWATRCGCGIYKNKQGADPSGTIFDGIKYATENGYDIALADTAGRLHNKKDLVEELKKIYRVSGKAMEGAPHQVILVLDATNGQNALIQARDFGEAIPFTGIILTKLDGTAKGGVILGICEEFTKPIHYIGIGEMIDDLRAFQADEFVEALFNDENVSSHS